MESSSSQSSDAEFEMVQRSIESRKQSRATDLSPLERLRGGADLFDEGMRLLKFAILSENPDFTSEQVDAEIERRKKIVRRIDDRGLYRPCETAESDDEV